MRILVVDDSNFVRNVVKNLIKNDVPGADVFVADNGMTGYSAYEIEKPDLIVTDLLMPEMSGEELISKIRETDKDIKIIVLTADVQKATKEEVEKYGILEYINKPVSGDSAISLVQAIRGVFGC
jgi:two-component system, chemotaxis family, chemotaxis protein CheY